MDEVDGERLDVAPNGGKLWLKVGGKLDIVKAHDGHLIRN
jgi:hypothetical protein